MHAMAPGFLISGLAGMVAALGAAAISRRRRGNYGWAMLIGLGAGAVSGAALFELGAGAIGGMETLFDIPDASASVAFAIGGGIGGVAATAIYQVLRSILFAPIQRAPKRDIGAEAVAAIEGPDPKPKNTGGVRKF